MNELKESFKNPPRPIEETNQLLIVSAEASSCLYAKLFIKQWKSFYPKTCFFGIGDREMQSQGMDCAGLAETLAVVGFQEVLSNQREIRKSFKNLVKMAEQRKPRFALLLDYPGFNLRLAVRLKKLKIPVVYYLSPQVWAWKEGRVGKIKKFVDTMMVVFPFEVDFYKKHGIEAHFVGHPLVEVIEEESKNLLKSKHQEMENQRDTLSNTEHSSERTESKTPTPLPVMDLVQTGLAEVKPQNEVLFFNERKKIVLGLMPGSRKSEIKHNLKIQLLAVEKLKEKYDLEIRLLTAPTLNIDFLKDKVGSFAKIQPMASRNERHKNLKTEFESVKLNFSIDGPLISQAEKSRDIGSLEIVKSQPTEMIKSCDLILAASGTATLQVALCGKPMVVMYSMNSFTAFLAKFFVGHLRHYCIVNIIAGEEVVPEFIQSEAQPEILSRELEKLLKTPDYRNKMIQSFEKISRQLGEGKATSNLVHFLRKKYGDG